MDPDIKISGMFKDYHTLLTKRRKDAAEFQDETGGTSEQRQRVFSIQQWRFSLFDFSFDITIENIFQKVWCQLCGTFGGIQH